MLFVFGKRLQNLLYLKAFTNMFVWLHPLLTFGAPLVGIRFSRVIGSPVYLICILWIAVPILITSGIASLFCSFSLEVCLGFSRGKVFRHGLLSFPLTIFTYFGAHAARTGIPRFKISVPVLPGTIANRTSSATIT